MSLSLYHICNELSLLFQNLDIDETTGEVNPEFKGKLDQIIMEKQGKVLNIGRLIKNLNAESNAIKSEVDILNARRKRIDTKINWLKDYLTASVSGEKYSDSCVEIGWRKSTAVVITDETKVPISLCRHIPERFEPDKILIKDSFFKGIPIDGAILEERLGLQIK